MNTIKSIVAILAFLSVIFSVSACGKKTDLFLRDRADSYGSDRYYDRERNDGWISNP
ncbi:MAG: hypothetical protein JW944_03780 [Deltaproteobacteria bacterium]|nr:hypothetical protein [Deltaproteobacteria bacterium]